MPLTTLEPAIALLGRVLLAAIFVHEAWSKLAGYDRAVTYMQAFGLPGALLPLAIAVELGGGLLVAAGLFTRWAALPLAGFAMDGFPKAPPPIRLMLWLARHSIGPKKLKQYLATGDMGFGKPTMPQSVPAPGADDRDGVAKFREMVERVNRFAGTPLPSPFFGSMDRDTWVKLNCVHAAHHLSFLVPKHA